MGSRGDCFDNAVLESFHASLKKDLIHRRSWPSKAEARTAVFGYIETFYNRRRRDSRLGMRSPLATAPPVRTSSRTARRQHFGVADPQVAPAAVPVVLAGSREVREQHTSSVSACAVWPSARGRADRCLFTGGCAAAAHPDTDRCARHNSRGEPQEGAASHDG